MDFEMDIDVVKLKNLIVSLCQIVLTRNDSLSKGEAKNYIDHLKDDELKILNETKLSSDQKLKSIVDTIIDTEIMTYIQSYQTSVDNQKPYTGSPFDFDSAGNFSKFITYFTDEFEEKYPDAKIPELISCIFLRIDHYSEQYRMFEQFYVIRSQETSRQILSKTKEEAKRAVKEGVNSAAEEAAEKAAVKAAEEAAVKAAEEATRLAQQSAIKASVEAEKAKETAKEAVNDEVEKKMADVSKKVSEVSVTILGIFSGIVITVITFLSYSSSAIENISKVNFFTLLCVSSFVGFICFNLIALLLNFILKVNSKSKSDTSEQSEHPGKLDLKIMVINFVIIIVMILSGIAQFFIPMPKFDSSATTQETIAPSTISTNESTNDNLE